MYAIDYSWARPNPPAIKAAGYSGVIRYVSRPDSNGKNITKPELDALRAAGLDVTLNFEQYEHRPLEGRNAGCVDAQSANALANKVGYPDWCAIYYSVDFAASWGSVREYFQGIKATSIRPVGIYAGLPLCHAAMDEGLARFAWITNAASWSSLSSWGAVRDEALRFGRCHLLQHLHSNTPAHIAGSSDNDFDPNTILNPHYGQWGDNSQEDEMNPAQELRLIAVQNAVGRMELREIDLQNRVAVLEGKDPAAPAEVDTEALAQAVVNALPKDQASKVADELAKRLSE